jgi:hypothetical protein
MLERWSWGCRCTCFPPLAGVAITNFYGNFFIRGSDLLALPNVSCDTSFNVELAHEEVLAQGGVIAVQARRRLGLQGHWGGGGGGAANDAFSRATRHTTFLHRSPPCSTPLLRASAAYACTRSRNPSRRSLQTSFGASTLAPSPTCSPRSRLTTRCDSASCLLDGTSTRPLLTSCGATALRNSRTRPRLRDSEAVVACSCGRLLARVALPRWMPPPWTLPRCCQSHCRWGC